MAQKPKNNKDNGQLTMQFDEILPAPIPAVDTDGPVSDLPLPERIALGGEDWMAFPLQFHDVDDTRYYAVQDWIRGVAQLSDKTEADLSAHVSKLWHDAKRRSARISSQTSEFIRSLKYVAPDGKKYNRDFSTVEGLYVIAQHLRSASVLNGIILDYLAKAGVLIDEMRRDPQKAIDAGMAGYKKQGKSDEWIDLRLKGIDTFKQLTAEIDAKMSSPNYGQIVNTEYKALFGKLASELCEILHTKSVRNALPALQLSWLTTAELTLKSTIENMDTINERQLMNTINKIVIPMGEMLKEHCASVGIHHITGQKLLK